MQGKSSRQDGFLVQVGNINHFGRGRQLRRGVTRVRPWESFHSTAGGETTYGFGIDSFAMATRCESSTSASNDLRLL